MSDEYETTETSYSPFVPLLILLIGLFAWLGYHVYAQNETRRNYEQQFQAALPTINAAQGVGNKYVALMKDLLQTSAKDQYAAQIVKDAIKAGWIRVNPSGTPTAGTNTTTTPAAPTPDASAPAPTK